MIFSRKKDNINPQTSLFREAVIFFVELFKVIVISLAIILPVRYFLIQPFYVKGASMEPNFVDHQYLIIDELTYRFRTPMRGEVVVFRYPKRPSEFFIKRVIGLPGEKIRIETDTIFIVTPDGREITLEEGYLRGGESFGEHGTVEIGLDEYFLLGDNRDESLDSRSFGPVNKKFLTGRVFFIGWPLDEIGIYRPPKY